MHRSWGGGMHPKPHVLLAPWASPCPTAGVTCTSVSHTVSEGGVSASLRTQKRARPYTIPFISVILWCEACKGTAEAKASCSHSLLSVKDRAAQLQGMPGRGPGGLGDGRDFTSGKMKVKEMWLPIKGSSAQLQPRHSPFPLTSEKKSFFFLPFFFFSQSTFCQID